MDLNLTGVRCARWIILTVLALGVGAPLAAEEVVFRATGYVTQTTHPDIAIDDPFEIVFAFDTTVPGDGWYPAGLWVYMQFGVVEKSFDGGFVFDVRNDYSFPWLPDTFDQYSVYFPPGGSPFLSNMLRLTSYGKPDLFDSNALPLVPPPILPGLSDNFAVMMDENLILVEYPGYVEYALARGPITSMELVVPDPAVLLEDLITETSQISAPPGIVNSLQAKLNGALQSWNSNRVDKVKAATNKIGAFIHEVRAQRDKKIAIQKADKLEADAEFIIQEMKEAAP